MNEPGRRRSSIRPGMTVLVVLKQDQATGRLTQGVVQEILTRSSTHPHGIKVRLQSGQVGRVQQIVSLAQDRLRAEDGSNRQGSGGGGHTNGGDGEGEA